MRERKRRAAWPRRICHSRIRLYTRVYIRTYEREREEGGGGSLPKHAGACLVQFARTCPSERSFERSVVLSSPPRGIRRIRSSSLFRVDRSVSVFTRNVVKSGWIFDPFVHSTREDSRILFTKYELFLDERSERIFRVTERAVQSLGNSIRSRN